MSNLVHLHGHSQASLLDAMTRPKELMERVSSIDQVAVAVTDHGNSYAVAELIKTAKDYKVKLIAGNEFYVANLGMKDRSARDSYHLTVLCDGSREGWKNLCNLHYLSFAEGYYYNNRIDLDVLAEHSDGLIALSGCMGGAAIKALLNDNEAEAERRIKLLKQIFGPERFFIELQNHGLEGDKVALPWLRKAAKKFGLKTVATNDFHYCNKDDWKCHDVLIAVGKNQCVYDPNRQIAYEPEMFYVKDYDEMAEMGFTRAELEQSHKIAEMCEPLKLDAGPGVYHIPTITIPKDYFNPPPKTPKHSKEKLAEMYFITEVQRGMINRYGSPLPSEAAKRMQYEEEAIIKAGFVDYMMIVADIYDFMRREKIPFGPGRGSVGGSIVAYALGITEIDPLKYNLLFERFINPERVSLPDVDMDISAVHRDKVIAYLREKYGDDKTALLITFQSIGGRAAIRDVGRAYNLPLEKADLLAKSIPQEGSLTKDRESRAYLEAALESQKVLREAYESDETVKNVIDAGIRLEGVTKAVSKHAAGFVISDEPLKNLVPMGIKSKGEDPEPNVVGFEMHFIEAMGLIKFDLLGLRNVDVVADCISDMIRHKAVSKNFTAHDIPLDDRNTFDMLCKGLTAGCFQIEGSGMTGWLRKMQPDRVEDIMAMVALFRPGPMEHIPTYINRKQGKEKLTYPHPSLKTILEPTFGVPVYQEQLMQIGQKIAGWSLARADQLRKVIGKKIIDDIAKEKKEFVAGAKQQGFKPDWAEKLFTEFIEPAARYSFNCLSGGTVVLRSSAGRFCNSPAITLADLYEAQESNSPTGRKLRNPKRGLMILQMCDDGFVRPGKLKRVHKTGEQTVYQITTQSGKSIKATARHRFLTTEGYKTVAYLLSNPQSHSLISMGGNASNYEAKSFHSSTANKRTVTHFNDGEQNGQWIDGRAVKFREAVKIVRERSEDRCEECSKKDDGKRHTLEFAHIKSLDECSGDIDVYQSPKNLLHLCNSHHKKFDYAKGERVKRWTHGKVTFADPIISIEDCGIEDTYDVEMDTPEHNFVANGVISHNSAHSTAYGLLAYQTAYLKCNYPTFYFAALLKSIEDHPKRDEKMTAYIADAREMGIAILPPDINQSDFSFTPIAKEKAVRFGLNGIKFVGSKAVQEIIAKREKEPFTEFFSTIERLKSQHTNSRMLEALIKSGAMDSLPGNRASKLASLPAAMERADMLREDQKRIAAGGKPVKRKKPIPEPIMVDTSEDKVQMLAGERELIGYYLSSHPYLDFASSVSASHTVQQAREVNNEEVTVGGIISRLTLHTTKKGKQQMAFGAIEDDKAVIEFVIFPRQFSKLANIVKLDAPLVLTGKVESNDEGDSVAAKLLVNNASPIARGLKKAAKSIEYEEVITLPAEGYLEVLQKARKRLNSTEGITDLKFILADGSEVKVVA